MEKNSNLLPIVCTVEYVNKNDVSSIAEGTTEYHRTVTLKSGKTWTTIYFTPGTVEWKENSKSSSAGPYYEQELSVFFPGEDTSNLADFNNIENCRFIVKMTFSSGTVKLFGDTENPVLITKDFSTEKNGSIITFSRLGADKAYIV